MRLIKNPRLLRLVFTMVAVALLSIGSAARLNAAAIAINFSTAPGADGTLTFLSDPNGAQPAHDSFFANIVSPQFGSGTLSVPSDFTNYITATGHADLAIFTFGAGTLSGSVDVILDLAKGAAMPTYHITSGTGVFAGATGTLTESAHFTSFGSYSQGIPATAAIDSGGGTVTVIPEPGTLIALGLGLAGGYLRKRSRA